MTQKDNKGYLANCITIVRILCSSIALLLFPAFSTAFYVLYITSGVSDMVDGWVARRIFAFLLPLQRYRKDIS